MNPRPDFCPGCGAQVYPEEAHCPFCGRNLRSSPWLSFLMGLGGAAAALLVGALVWWVLDALPPAEGTASPAVQQEAARPEPPAPPVAAQQAAAPDAPQAPGSSLTSPLASNSDASAFAPPPDPAAAPAAVSGAPPAAGAPAPSTKDMERFASTSSGPAPAGGAPQPASLAEQQLPLPTLHGPAPEVAADSQARRDFAKSTQDRFTENGLDLTVGTSGEAETILTIKFNFPAKTAAELIVAGPFPRQCAQRGFTQVVFQDPSGVSWLYDVASQQMTQR